MNPLKESLQIIKRRKKTHYIIIAIVFVLLFSQAFFAGQYLYRTDAETAKEFMGMVSETAKIKMLLSLFEDGRYVAAGTLIFLNNFLIDVFSMYLGIIIAVPVFVLLSNAIVTGMVFGIGSLMRPTGILHVIFTLIVGLFEISSFILITYEGLRIGTSWLNPKIFKKKKRRDALKQAIKEGTKILPLIMLLLILAAIIETIGIVLFTLRFVA